MLNAGAHICNPDFLTTRWEAEARGSTKDQIHNATTRNTERPCLKTFYLGENQHPEIVLDPSPQNKKYILITFACEMDEEMVYC